jgi:transposase
MKTGDQQAVPMPEGLREKRNAIRGYPNSVYLWHGVCRIEPLLDRLATDQTLPALARDLLGVQVKEHARLAQLKTRLLAC